MGLFGRLFGKKTIVAEAGGKVAFTPEQLFKTDAVQLTLVRYGRESVLLKPERSAESVSPQVSKFGGMPNGNGFDAHPCCDACGTPLNFVLQLYKTGFPQHYFPEGKNLFQLFRCPNDACPSAFSAPYHSYRKLFIYYFTDEPGKEQVFALPEADRTELEDLVPDCMLHPEKQADYPHYEDFDTVINDIEAMYGEKLGEAFMEKFGAIQKTKSGGYPSFTQGSFYPACSCGQPKEFFFQLSSDDTVDGPKSLQGDDWSPHGIMIGDVGNIYFYVCRSCGESSIETYWDCY
jgi:uncharacterized protein YwqG